MALIEGKTAQRIADMTVFENGQIKWGFSRSGTDHCAVTIVKSAMKHHSVRSAEYRVSALFVTGMPPSWWGPIHVKAVNDAMGKMRWELERAATASTKGNIIDVSSDRSKGSVPELSSK